jgi:hypothetical protein
MLAQTRELAERDDRTRKSDRTDECTDEQLQAIAAGHGRRNVEGRRIVHYRNGNQHRGHPHQRMHRRDQLGHLRHLDAPRDRCADRPAHCDAGENQPSVMGQRERRQHRDEHADDAEQIAPARGERRGEAFERQDEQHRCN